MTRTSDYARNDQVIVTNASVLISQHKPASERTDLVLFNFDVAATISITLSDAQPAVAGSGIMLRPGYGLCLSKSQGYTIPQCDVSAISSAASAVTNLSVYERYQEWEK